MPADYTIPETNNILDNDAYHEYKAQVYANQEPKEGEQAQYYTTRISIYNPVERREVTYDGPKVLATSFEQAQLLLDLGSKKVHGIFVPA
jgi:hypothetical protein